MDTSILEDIGLTGAEIKVFIALLELGSSTAGNVVEKSGLQNAVVHRAFHSLAEKGLITFVFEGKIKQYQAIEPKLLLNFIDEKKSRIEKILPAGWGQKLGGSRAGLNKSRKKISIPKKSEELAEIFGAILGTAIWAKTN